jgi:hypothetical protein
LIQLRAFAVDIINSIFVLLQGVQMNTRNRPAHILPILLTAGLCSLIFSPQVRATSYSAGVTEEHALYSYYGGAIGEGEFESYQYVGFDYGIGGFAEVGVCWTLGDGFNQMTSPVIDAKLSYNADEEGRTAFAVGLDNWSHDEDYNGNGKWYVVCSHDFNQVRGHAGYIFEDENNAVFLATDWDMGDISAGVDWSQIDDGKEWEASGSIYVPLPSINEDCAFYSYYTFSSDPDQDGYLTAEIQITLD